MFNYWDNSTQSQLETVLSVAFYTVVIIIGILGNSFVIWATMHYISFRLDRITVIFVRNIAIADLLYVVISVVPTFVSYINNNRWVFGHLGCAIVGHVTRYLQWSNLNFIFLVSLHRVGLLTTGKARYLAMIVWAFNSVEILMLVISKVPFRYRQSTSRCIPMYDKFKMEHPALSYAVLLSLLLVPFTGTIIINIILLIFSRTKSKQSIISSKALVTVTSISTFLILSWLPILVFTLLTLLFDGKKYIGIDIAERVAARFYMLSVFSNPFIYCMFNKAFAKFSKRALSRMIERCLVLLQLQRSTPRRVVKIRRITRDDHRMRQARRITEVRVSIPKSEAKEQKSVIASNSLQELDETSF